MTEELKDGADENTGDYLQLQSSLLGGMVLIEVVLLRTNIPSSIVLLPPGSVQNDMLQPRFLESRSTDSVTRCGKASMEPPMSW